MQILLKLSFSGATTAAYIHFSNYIPLPQIFSLKNICLKYFTLYIFSDLYLIPLNMVPPKYI